MRGYAFCDPFRNDFGDLLDAGGAQLRHASEISEQFLRRAWADAGDVLEARLNRALRSPLAMESHGESVRFIANLLNEMENGRVMLQPDRLIFLSEDEDDLVLFRDARDGLVDHFELFERRTGRVQLADSAVDQDQPGEGLLLLL